MNSHRRLSRTGATLAGVAAFYLAVTVLFSWPTALFKPEVFYTRQFDLYGVLWMISHAREVLVERVVNSTNWPLGENATRPDAYLLMLVALLTRGLVSPLVLVSLFVLLGPVAGALAAERCASQGFQVRRPWSLLAGLAYGFNGLASTAWLEGHIYFLFNPWLPLLLLALVRATQRGAPDREAVKAGLYWILALATSAYIGIMASCLVVGMAIRAAVVARDDRRLIRRLFLLAGTILPFGIWYVALFLTGSGQRAPDLWESSTTGSATLAGLASWWPGVDGKTCHSIATPIGFVTLSLGAMAPVLLKRYRGWRTLLVISAGAVLVSLGPLVSPGLGLDSQLPAPLALLAGTPLMTYLHFPVRFLWLTYLCGGMLAARAADELARRAGTLATSPLILMAVVDAVLVTGAPLRAEGVLATVPSAYNAAPRDLAVLDLFAGQAPPVSEINMRVTKLTAYYHTVHGRPILAAALPARGRNCRDRVSEWLIEKLTDMASANDTQVRRELRNLETTLADLGVGAVAVHTDLFPQSTLPEILQNLRAALGPPAAVSRDGGETLVLFVLRKRSTADPAARYRRLLSHETRPEHED